MTKQVQNVEYLNCWENVINMIIFNTKEMDDLFDKFEPYLNKEHQLSEDAPEEVRCAFKEYQKLGKEQMDFAYSL